MAQCSQGARTAALTLHQQVRSAPESGQLWLQWGLLNSLMLSSWALGGTTSFSGMMKGRPILEHYTAYISIFMSL